MHGHDRYEPVTNSNVENVPDENASTTGTCVSSHHGESLTCDYCGNSRNSSIFRSPAYDNKDAIKHSDTGLSSQSGRSRRSVLTELPRLRFMREWWLELVGCLLIVGAVLAIVATAYSYDERPLPAWPNGITINSLFAIYVVVLKAAMLLILTQGLSHLKWTWFAVPRPLNDLAKYDNASRGPLGSAGLLWSLRGRDLVSSVGAIIVVAAVILDPMAQQLITYWNCPQPLPGQSALISRTNAYMETGLHVGAGISTIPVSLQAAINGGVFVPSASTVSFDCPSGNCTFSGPYFTMGFSSECDDVSNEILFQNVTRSWNYTEQVQNPANTSQYASEVISVNGTMLNATLPSGLSASYDVGDYPGTSYMTMSFNDSTNLFEIILGPPTVNPLTLGDLCTGENANEPITDWNCRGWGAARCKLLPAVLSVESNVTSGVLVENITVSNGQFAAANTARSAVDVSCLTNAQKSALSEAGYTIPQPHEPQWLPYNVSVYVYPSDNMTFTYQSDSQTTSEAVKTIVPPKCIYQFSSISTMSLDIFFSDYLSGSITPLGSQWTGSSVAQQFYNAGDLTFDRVDTMFQNISRALTAHVRENGAVNNSASAVGDTWHTETCVRVRWPLITFPAVLATLTLCFFAAMILETKRAQHGVHHDFKSSPLALLFHGLDEQGLKKVERSHVAESNEVQDLKHEAKHMSVQLKPTERGWRFVVDGER